MFKIVYAYNVDYHVVAVARLHRLKREKNQFIQ
jgi:hypothetical protein